MDYGPAEGHEAGEGKGAGPAALGVAIPAQERKTERTAGREGKREADHARVGEELHPVALRVEEDHRRLERAEGREGHAEGRKAGAQHGGRAPELEGVRPEEQTGTFLGTSELFREPLHRAVDDVAADPDTREDDQDGAERQTRGPAAPRLSVRQRPHGHGEQCGEQRHRAAAGAAHQRGAAHHQDEEGDQTGGVGLGGVPLA